MDKVLSEMSPYYLNGGDISDSDRRIISIFAEWWSEGGRGQLASVDDLGIVLHATFDFDQFCAAVTGVVGDFASCVREEVSSPRSRWVMPA